MTSIEPFNFRIMEPYRDGALLTPSRARRVAVQLKRDLIARGRTGQMIIWGTNFARAYVYNGEWVADCPADCKTTQFVEDKPDKYRGVPGTSGDRMDYFHCGYCTSLWSSVRWPDRADEIKEILDRRPLRHTRNWYPEGHIVALQSGIRDGETIEELLAENYAHGID